MDSSNRKSIGFIFTYFAADWLGGYYYLISIINSLNSLPEGRKPRVYVFYNHKAERLLPAIQYPYTELVYHHTSASNYLNYIRSILTGRNYFIGDIIEKYQLDGLYPLIDFPLGRHDPSCKVVSWFPDFQHKFYPEYFSKFNILFRDIRIKRMLQKTHALVLSSQDSLNHLRRFYDVPSDLPIHLLRFVSNIEKPVDLDIDTLKANYGIDKPFFMVCNQFYIHKNHWVVLRAIRLLKKDRQDFLVVFTGKEEDYKDSGFVKSLKQYILEQDLTACVRFLGVIPRTHQSLLMSHTLAVIQPSKFEGWSTVVEDAKSLQAQLILSDISVHLEQMEDRGFYFSPDAEGELSSLMNNFLNHSLPLKPVLHNLSERISLFAHTFVKIFDE